MKTQKPSCTVGELISELEIYPKNAKVYITSEFNVWQILSIYDNTAGAEFSSKKKEVKVYIDIG